MTPARPAPPQGLTIRLFVPGLLVNPLNARRHWSETARDAAKWRERTHAIWLAFDRPTWDGPAHFTFTAYTVRNWDASEGSIAACKAIRDEAVKLICGTDDSPASGHRFSYAQEVRARNRGVLITVEARYPSGRDGQQEGKP